MKPSFFPVRLPGIRLRRLLQGFLWVSIVLLLSCKQEKEDLTIVKFYGNGSVSDLTMSFLMHSTPCLPGKAGGLAMNSGDILVIEDWLLPFDDALLSKDGSLHFVSSDTALFINGRLAGVRLGNAPPLTSWFDTGDLDLIRSLRVLLVDEGGYAQKQTLKKIASIKPVLSLQLNTPPDADELKFMLGLFDPPALSLETDVSSLQLLAGENELKALYLNLDDSMAVLSPLPAIPNLNTLMANLSKDSVLDLRKPHGGFFKNNPQVQHVVLSQWADAYPKGLLSELKDLRTLVAFGSAIGSEEILAHEQSLRRLMTDTLDLQLKLPRLQHASVANSAEQAGLLDTLVSKFPQLSALDIYADGGPMDISPILSLAQLKALTIVDADSIDITPLKQMTQLKMLSFSTADSLQESKLDELKTALPATLVVPNEGFCLGSGWLLLLVPFTMLAIYLAGKGQSKKKFTVQ